MTVSVLVSGALSRDPQSRTSKAGKPFVVASLRVVAGNEVEFWNLLAFSAAAQAELMRLGEGDKLSAQGSLKLEVFTSKDGTPKVSRTIIADLIVALRQPPKERRPKREAARQAAPASAVEPHDMAFNDDLPWGGP